MSELLHELLPVAAGAQVGLVKASDVLHDLLPLHSLPERHVLSDVSGDLRDVLRLPIQPLQQAETENRKTAKKCMHMHHFDIFVFLSERSPPLRVGQLFFPGSFAGSCL